MAGMSEYLVPVVADNMTANASSNAANAMSAISRSEIEDFLFFEADLLDDWELLRWAQLFTDDGVYLIPPFSDPNADRASVWRAR